MADRFHFHGRFSRPVLVVRPSFVLCFFLSFFNASAFSGRLFRRQMAPAEIVGELGPVLPSFIQFDSVFMGFTGFYWVLPGFI